jgi:hypothetical protein
MRVGSLRCTYELTRRVPAVVREKLGFNAMVSSTVGPKAKNARQMETP